MNYAGSSARFSILVIGAIALAVVWIFCFIDPQHALRAYLYAWLACLGIALGAMSIIMLHALTGGRWGTIARPPSHAATMTLPLLLILFIPIGIGLPHIYPWANPSEVASHVLLRHRQVFFHPWFVIVRTVIYFAIWIFWSWRLEGLSNTYERTRDPMIARQMRILSGAGFVIYFATMSLAAMDWIASREVDWYSSTFGLLTILGQSVIAVAFLIIVLAIFLDSASADNVHDMGNLLLTCVILWSYVAFAQFLVIWIGNSQEDITWYYHRSHHGWNWVGTAIILLHFALPFVLLLFQPVKRSLKALAWVAALVLLMRVVHVLWMIAPSTTEPEPHTVHWLDFVAPFGVGGIWFAYFLFLLKGRPMRISTFNESEMVDGSDASTIRPVA